MDAGTARVTKRFRGLEVKDKNMSNGPEAKVVCDSVSVTGSRLTTIQAKIHRFVLAELNTHRAFSRNSASSRAVPARKLRQMVIDDPAMPVWWGKNQPGMSAEVELAGEEKQAAIGLWIEARDEAVSRHQKLEEAGIHKQLINRILEPFLWHHVIISATEWDNFFHQRVHKAAQPEMRAAATAIWEAYSSSAPVVLDCDEWHLPFFEGDRKCLRDGALYEAKAISAGRCARVSYLTHEGVRDTDKDVELFEKLKAQSPGHWSPLEHVARPQADVEFSMGNFTGWRQLRHIFEPVTTKFSGSVGA